MSYYGSYYENFILSLEAGELTVASHVMFSYLNYHIFPNNLIEERWLPWIESQVRGLSTGSILDIVNRREAFYELAKLLSDKISEAKG